MIWKGELKKMAVGTHDVVIIDGGHNGLVVAAYLAKAGIDVCVLGTNSARKSTILKATSGLSHLEVRG